MSYKSTENGRVGDTMNKGVEDDYSLAGVIPFDPETKRYFINATAICESEAWANLSFIDLGDDEFQRIVMVEATIHPNAHFEPQKQEENNV